MYEVNNIIDKSHSLRLLYVEDNDDARESKLLILRDFFDEIIVAVDGEDGINKFNEYKIDIVITDINMPKLNGLDMSQKIKNINSSIPILVLSAYNDAEYFTQSIKIGIDGYLLKPIDIKQFIEVLKKVIDRLYLEKEVQNNIHFLKQYQEATNHSSIVSKTDIKGNITYVNEDFCKISEYSEAELIGENHNIVRHPNNPESLFVEMWHTLMKKKTVWKGLIRNMSKSGKSYYVKTTIQPIVDAQGNIVEYIALRDDVTDIMNPKKQLQDLVESCDDMAVVMMKIDNFEDIEKFYGQTMIEEIEGKFADILMENRPTDCEFEKVFPLGHGVYVFAKKRSSCTLGVENVIRQLKEFQQNIGDISIDIGDVEYDVAIIMSLAYGQNVLENAAYGIKRLEDTKQDFIVANNFAEDEQNSAKKNIETLKKIKKAINEFKIVSYFQPIIDNKTKKITKYESLVRLIDEDDKVLSPFFFLDIAKRGKYYSQITSRVLENSFGALKDTDVNISINISALDIERRNTRMKLFELLQEHKKDAHRIVFELLEDENVKDLKIIREFIISVKSLGVRIAIDDFGAGYSNFERLLDYQPDLLKIDGSLIRDIETNSYSQSVVKTIVTFAKEQNIETIAEYVENENIYNILNEMGVNYSQGYYFGKPEPLSDFIK